MVSGGPWSIQVGGLHLTVYEPESCKAPDRVHPHHTGAERCACKAPPGERTPLQKAEGVLGGVPGPALHCVMRGNSRMAQTRWGSHGTAGAHEQHSKQPRSAASPPRRV